MKVDQERYQQLVEKLIYLSCNRPCITYVVSIVSQFMHAPKEIHIEAIFKILSSLKSTPDRSIEF